MEPIIVSWSEIDTGRQCRLKHHMAYNERWTKPVADDSPLGKGLLWHSIMETRYDTIRVHQLPEGGWDVPADALEEACTLAVSDVLGKFLKDGGGTGVADLMRWMYRGYVDVYGLDPEHVILGVETTHLAPLGEIDIPHPWHHGEMTKQPVMLKFKIDRTIRDKWGHVRVIDEKSHGQLPSDHDYDFLDQFGLYVWGLRQLGINVRGAIHSASKTKQNQGDIFKTGDAGWKSTMKATPLDARFKRTPIHYTDAQLRGIASDALADIQELYAHTNRHQRQADSDRCKWRCSYTEACLFERRTGKAGDMVKMLERQGFTQERERH
jgi:hypothetical protein